MKMMKKGTALLLFFVTACLTAQSVKLEYKVQKGDKFLVSLKMNQNMAPIMTMDIGVEMITETTNVANGKIENKSQIKRMKMDISAQGESVNYDSNKKESELSEEEKKMHQEIAPALDIIIYQTLDVSGKILSQKIVPELKQANQLLNQNQFSAMEYPKEALKVGSSWNFKQDMGGMKMNAKYTVTKISSTTLFADVSGTIDGVTEAVVGGKLEIDLATGMPSNVKMDIVMGSSAMGMKMGIEMTTTKL